MALKTVLDKAAFDKLSDALKAEYTVDEEDGNYYLDAEDIDSHPKVKGLKSAFEKQKREASELRTAAKKWKDRDPDKYDQMIADAAELEEKAATKKGDFDKLRQGLVDQHAKELAKKDEQIGKRDKHIRKLTIDDVLNAQLDKVKVKPEFKDGARAVLRQTNPEVVEDGDDYKAVVRTDAGDIPFAEYIETWAKTDAASHYLQASGKGGSGAPAGGGTGGGKGMKPGTFNGNDPVAWGKHADAVVKGEMEPVY